MLALHDPESRLVLTLGELGFSSDGLGLPEAYYHNEEVLELAACAGCLHTVPAGMVDKKYIIKEISLFGLEKYPHLRHDPEILAAIPSKYLPTPAEDAEFMGYVQENRLNRYSYRRAYDSDSDSSSSGLIHKIISEDSVLLALVDNSENFTNSPWYYRNDFEFILKAVAANREVFTHLGPDMASNKTLQMKIRGAGVSLI